MRTRSNLGVASPINNTFVLLCIFVLQSLMHHASTRHHPYAILPNNHPQKGNANAAHRLLPLLPL